MPRKLALIVVAIAALATAACSDITAPTDKNEACPIYPGSGRCDQ